LFITNL
jgi:brefeldin A-inhibited guanine nucleotide-exchange protein